MSIFRTVSPKVGEAFFQGLASEMTRALHMRYAIIGRIDEQQPGLVHTLAFCENGNFLENFDYQLLKPRITAPP